MTKDKELSSQSLSEQGDLEEAEQETAFASRAPAQPGDLEPQCPALKRRGREKKAQNCQDGCAGGTHTESPTLSGRMNQKESVASFAVPGECRVLASVLNTMALDPWGVVVRSAVGFQSTF